MSRFADLRLKDLELTRKLVRESVSPDQCISNAINSIDDLQKISNSLSKRLREWYGLVMPELDKNISDNKEYASLILEHDKHKLISQFKVENSMGADLKGHDLEEIRGLAKTILAIYDEQESLEEYIGEVMKHHCENFTKLAGAIVGAKLLRGAGSLKDLAMMRSSTIQLIGAEKALFRHIKTGARPPKYGFILQHPLVQNAKRDMQGKAARALADKLFIAARVDYFKGEPVADKLLKELEVRFR